MPAKKSNKKKSKPSRSAPQLGYFHGADELMLSLVPDNGRGRRQPYHINPETKEEREKRLAARKALTLKAARIAYENHHQRKAS
jgi:hypothetical protein